MSSPGQRIVDIHASLEVGVILLKGHQEGYSRRIQRRACIQGPWFVKIVGMTRSLENLYSLDVEADGPCSGIYSMLSFGMVPLDRPQDSFYTTLAPITNNYVPDSLKACGFTREQSLRFTPADEAMRKFSCWLAVQPGKGRKVVWSDNPAFDWQFFNYYCHRFLGGNAFGYSARRIGDYFSGTQGDARKSQGWKKWRTEPHTHNALEDARGNAGALRRLLKVRPEGALQVSEGLEIAAYQLPDGSRLEQVAQRDGRRLWAIRKGGNCLNRSGQWEWEPSPSSRDEAFFFRCRWGQVDEAHRAWEKSRRRGP